jgi:hypothetical protein
LIKKAVLKKKERGERVKLPTDSMHLTRAGNGINVKRCSYDEYEIL